MSALIYNHAIKLIAILMAAMILTACSSNAGTPNDRADGAETNEALTEEEMQNPRTDIETINKWFPNLKGVQEVLWEGEILGSDNSDVPGPSTIHARGVITLTPEQAQEYKNAYTWENAAPTIEAGSFDTGELAAAEWLYSDDFEEDCKPMYFQGGFWFNGQQVWFDVVK